MPKVELDRLELLFRTMCITKKLQNPIGLIQCVRKCVFAYMVATPLFHAIHIRTYHGAEQFTDTLAVADQNGHFRDTHGTTLSQSRTVHGLTDIKSFPRHSWIHIHIMKL